ncbi:MAG: hypothetical protein AAF335_02870 [Bacteroidota bacterium]
MEYEKSELARKQKKEDKKEERENFIEYLNESGRNSPSIAIFDRLGGDG